MHTYIKSSQPPEFARSLQPLQTCICGHPRGTLTKSVGDEDLRKWVERTVGSARGKVWVGKDLRQGWPKS